MHISLERNKGYLIPFVGCDFVKHCSLVQLCSVRKGQGVHTSMLWASFMIFTMLGVATFVAKASPMCAAHSE